MNYVPGFGNLIWFLGVFGISGGFLYGISFVDDDWKYCDREWLWSLWTLAGLLVAFGLLGTTEHAEPLTKVCLMAMAIYLVVCTVMDSILCQVNDVVQYFGILGGTVFVLSSETEAVVGVSLILFAILQYFVFFKQYGGADGMAFLISALYLAGMGREIDSYLLHMTLSYVAMVIVQGIQGNISRKGKLIEPVAMLPYISLGFLLMVQPYAEYLSL